jgi:endonuclease/exonuclease/phosphatase (EEP) superfamily protein YafD
MVRERRADAIATEPVSTRERQRARPPWSGWVIPVLAAAVPWTWFAVRDLGPAMDALAFALPVGAAVLALVAFGWAMLSERMRLAVVSLSLAVFSVVVVIEPRLPQPSPAPVDPFRLVAANLFDGNQETRAAVHALVARHAAVVVPVETPPPLLMLLRRTLTGYSSARIGRISVFARWPVEPLGSIAGVPTDTAMRVRVDRPGAPFVVYALHLANPLHEVSWSQHAAVVERLLRSAEDEDLPVVLAGDFNMTDRSTSYRVLGGAMRDAMRSTYAGNTYEQALWVLLQLRIDHVFVSRRLCAADARTFGVPGSDHEGVEVELGGCP